MDVSGQPHASAASFRLNKPWYALNKMLCGPQSLSGCFGKKKFSHIFVPAGNRTLDRMGVTWGEGRGANAPFFYTRIVSLVTELKRGKKIGVRVGGKGFTCMYVKEWFKPIFTLSLNPKVDFAPPPLLTVPTTAGQEVNGAHEQAELVGNLTTKQNLKDTNYFHLKGRQL